MRACGRHLEPSLLGYVEDMILQGDFKDATSDRNGCTPTMVFFEEWRSKKVWSHHEDLLRFLDVLTTDAKTSAPVSMDTKTTMGELVYHGDQHLLYRDSGGLTPLHYIAQQHTLGPPGPSRNRIVQQIAQSTLRDSAGRVPLHLAASNMQDPSVCRELVSLAHGNVNCLSSSGIRCIDMACQYGRVDMVTVLLDVQDCLEIPGPSENNKVLRTPLLTAACYLHWDVVSLLLAKGANAKAVDSQRLGLVHYAAFKGRESLLDMIWDMPDLDFCSHGHYPLFKGVIRRKVSPLHLAAAYGPPSTMRTYLDRLRSNIEDTTDLRETPLFLASWKGNLKACKLLVEAGASVNRCYQREASPLHVAAIKGATDVVAYLLQCGADPSQRDSGGFTAELCALRHSHKDVVNVLRQQSRLTERPNVSQMPEIPEEGGTSNTADGGGNWSPSETLRHFHHAVVSKSVDYMQSVIKSGFDVNVHDENGDCPLKLAVLGGEEQIALLLIRKGAKCHPTASTSPYATCEAIHLAAAKNLLLVMEKLLEDGSNVEECASGMSPLHLSIWYHSDEVLKIILAFLERLAPDARHSVLHEKVAAGGVHIGDSAIHLAARVGYKVNVLGLLQLGLEVDARNHNRETALHIAASEGSIGIVNMLLEFGASLEARTNIGNTPLLHAMASNIKSTEVLELLLAWGANPYAKDIFGRGLLHLAAKRPSTQFVSFARSLQLPVNDQDVEGNTPLRLATTSSAVIATLIEAKASIEVFGTRHGSCLNDWHTSDGLAAILEYTDRLQPDKKMELVNFRSTVLGTALYKAASYENVENVRLLIEHGADMNAIGGEHGTPIQAAWKFGEYEVVRYLQSVGAIPFHLDDLAKEHSFNWLSGGPTYRQARTGAWKIQA